MTKNEVVEIIRHPIIMAKALDYNLLETRLHDRWIYNLAFLDHDYTLQAHRDSYKTTCMIIALALRIVLLPNEPNLLVRKDSASVTEVIRSVIRILKTRYMQDLSMAVNGKNIEFEKETQEEIQTNLVTDISVKESQLLGNGAQSFSITGKHFPHIYTDDIVTLKDRISKPARESTKLVYQELQNIRRGGDAVIINVGTPWHKNDAFELMPNPDKYDIYSTGLFTPDEIMFKKNHMTASLFSANYELKHVTNEDSFFKDPKYGDYPTEKVGKDIRKKASTAHIDASYGGDNTTALTITTRSGGHLHAHGKIYTGHVKNHYGAIVLLLEEYNVGTLYMETNADKGYLGDAIPWKVISTYFESMNKHIKIVTYLVSEWSDIIFDNETDPLYIEQIVDYQEGAEPDDAPDSLSSIIRQTETSKATVGRY